MRQPEPRSLLLPEHSPLAGMELTPEAIDASNRES